MSRKLFFLWVLFFQAENTFTQISNQNIIPIQIDCWSLNQNNILIPNPHDIKHYSCIVSPGTGNFVVNNNKEISFTAGKQVHLKPGFSVASLTGNGNFHAAVEKEEVSVVVFTPANTFGEVPKCEKLELGIKLPQSINDLINDYFNGVPHTINPFDPDHISIEAKFTYFKNGDDNYLYYYDLNNLPSGSLGNFERRTIYGFYYEEYHTDYTTYNDGDWIADTTSFNFRIRFAPNKVGLWRCDIVIKIDNQIVHTIKSIYFNCTPSNCPGFIVGGETTPDNRHFVFENGDAFFGIGQNIAWPDNKNVIMPTGYGQHRSQAPAGYDSLRIYFSALADNGGNLVRYINTEWTDALEWEKLGDYKQAMPFAWEFDRTFDLLAENEIYLLWVLQMHVPLMYHNNVSSNDGLAWPSNPYNTELGLPTIEAFFTDADAQKYFKRRLRYMMSRWGYSPQIAALQLLSEINFAAEDPNQDPSPKPYHTNSAFREDVNNWFIDMKDYIQDQLKYNFNVGSSFTSNMDGYSDNNSLMAAADFNDWHPYDDKRNRNIGSRWGTLNGEGYNIGQYGKPVMLGENGLDSYELHNCGENDWHNDLWASAMMGGWTTGLPWWIWKGKHNTRENFKFVREFFDTYIDFKNIDWEPRRWPDNLSNRTEDQYKYKKSRDNFFEVLYMTGDTDFNRDKRAFGWVHNRSSYWYNKRGTCEISLMWNLNNNSDLKDDIVVPGDDDNVSNVETQDGHSNRKNRNVRIHNMSNFQNFDMVWYDPLQGGTPMTTTSENHGTGAFIIQLPDQVNWTTYHDLVFLMSPNNSTFYNPGLNSEATEIFVLSNAEEQENDTISNLTETTSFEIFVYPNPTADKIKIECSEKISSIEICNIMGDKISEIHINASYGEIDMTTLSKGVYIFKTITESKTYINRIVYQ